MFQIDILFQDEHFAVINKPSGLAVFADRTSPHSLWDLLKAHFTEKTLYQVHRLDKDTSGVLLVAFSKQAQARLTQQFFYRTLDKTYVAICLGKPQPPSGLIDLPLCPGRKNSFRVAGPRDTIFVDHACDIPTWKLPQEFHTQRQVYPSQTLYHTVFSNEHYSLLELHPLTGRTHQIRVHLAWIGHQLLGDPLYGKPQSSLQQAERMALHSSTLQLTENWVPGQEPIQRSFQAPLPTFFEDTLQNMAQQKGISVPNWQQVIASAREDFEQTYHFADRWAKGNGIVR